MRRDRRIPASVRPAATLAAPPAGAHGGPPASVLGRRHRHARLSPRSWSLPTVAAAPRAAVTPRRRTDRPQRDAKMAALNELWRAAARASAGATLSARWRDTRPESYAAQPLPGCPAAAQMGQNLEITHTGFGFFVERPRKHKNAPKPPKQRCANKKVTCWGGGWRRYASIGKARRARLPASKVKVTR